MQGFNGFGREAQLDPTLALGPPDALFLQVGMLQPLGTAVGVGNGVGVVSLFPGELAFAAHQRSPVDVVDTIANYSVARLFVHVAVGGDGGGGDAVEVAEDPVFEDGVEDHREGGDE